MQAQPAGEATVRRYKLMNVYFCLFLLRIIRSFLLSLGLKLFWPSPCLQSPFGTIGIPPSLSVFPFRVEDSIFLTVPWWKLSLREGVKWLLCTLIYP